MSGRSLQGFREDVREIEVPETDEKDRNILDRKLLVVTSIYGYTYFIEGTEDYETIIELVRRIKNEIT